MRNTTLAALVKKHFGLEAGSVEGEVQIVVTTRQVWSFASALQAEIVQEIVTRMRPPEGEEGIPF